MQDDDRELSRGWRYGVLFVMAAGFAVLIWIAARTYQIGPPIPEKVVDAGGNTLFTGADITAGQQVFLKHGLMDNGTLWGHGAYLGPDFSAAYLHQLALDAGDFLAQRNFHRAAAELAPSERATLTGQVRELLVGEPLRRPHSGRWHSPTRKRLRTASRSGNGATTSPARGPAAACRPGRSRTRKNSANSPRSSPGPRGLRRRGFRGRAIPTRTIFLMSRRSATGRRPTPSSGAR